MKLARLAVFGIAILAAAGAGLVAVNMTAREPSEPIIITAPAAEPQVPLVEVLTTTRALPMGQTVEGALAWRTWPKEAVGEDLILRETRPEAISEIGRSIARQSFFSGEPVRETKLVRADRGFMSAILPSGKRAVAVRIAAETSAGGFILPNDHVDVIMTRLVDQNRYETETVLRNLRVLAIDQTIEEQNGTSVVVGSTATLEVDPAQAEALTVAQEMSQSLVLSLRSLSDSVPGSAGYARFLLEQELPERTRVKLVRYGRTSDVMTGN